MKGGEGGPVGPPDLGRNQIPAIDLDAQGRRMAGVAEKQLGCLLQGHAAIGAHGVSLCDGGSALPAIFSSAARAVASSARKASMASAAASKSTGKNSA